MLNNSNIKQPSMDESMYEQYPEEYTDEPEPEYSAPQEYTDQ